MVELPTVDVPEPSHCAAHRRSSRHRQSAGIFPTLQARTGFSAAQDRASSRTSPAPPMARAAPTAARRQCHPQVAGSMGICGLRNSCRRPRRCLLAHTQGSPASVEEAIPAPPGVAVVTCRGTGLSRCRFPAGSTVSQGAVFPSHIPERTPFPRLISIRPVRSRPMPPSI